MEKQKEEEIDIENITLDKLLFKFKVQDKESRKHYDSGPKPLPMNVDAVYNEYRTY